MKKITVLLCSLAFLLAFPATIKASEAGRTVPHYNLTEDGGKWDGTQYHKKDGSLVTDAFFCDGEFTYYLQADGTPMKDKLTYHPDGEHLIYLDEYGHEVFTNFKYCKSVGYTCYFDVNGYLYKDEITFVGDKVYYLNKNGAMEQNGWFQFANGCDYGYANSDGTLTTGGFSYDPFGRVVFYHWNGMVARGLITDGVYYYHMDETDGHYLGQFPVEGALNQKQNDIAGDGWSISDGTLYVSKIYYSAVDEGGTKKCIYEIPWSKYNDKISSIYVDADMVYKQESDEASKINISSLPGGGPLFSNMDSLRSMTIKRLNLDRITDISWMFISNHNLTQVDASGLNFSGVKDASYLFYDNIALTNIKLPTVNTPSLTTIAGMFRACSNLNSISISSWNTGNIKDFSHLFDDCSSLTSIDLSGWKINDAQVTAMFRGCSALSDVQLSDVTLQNTIPVNAMFDKNNSITSYEFASGWNICVTKQKRITPILDDCYTASLVHDQTTGMCVECVYYKKRMPEWYKSSVEYTQAIDDWTQILYSPTFDLYINKMNVSGEYSASEMAGIIIDSIEEVGVVDEGTGTIIQDTVTKLELLKKYKNGKISINEVAELLQMDVEDAKIFIESLPDEEEN